VEADPIDPVTATVIDGSAGEPQALFPVDASAAPPAAAAAPAPVEQPMARAEQRDAPYCYQCGNAMQRAGSCYVCGSCGTTSGCS
jgi:ribonucleoside-diphosphate reductase alpha chain